MTIQELINEAARLDPNLVIEAWDRVDYAPGRNAQRVVNVKVFSRSHGEGSHEPITLAMADVKSATGSLRMSDQVQRVVPGKTTLFWQADALIRAFDRLTPRSGDPGLGESR